MLSTLGELARLTGGTLHGDATVEIDGANPLADAKRGEITLIDSMSRIDDLAVSPVAAAIVPQEAAVVTMPRSEAIPKSAVVPTIAVDNPHAAFEQVVRFFRPARQAPLYGIHATAIVGSSAELADDVSIGPGVTIGDDTTIGTGTTIHAGAHIAAGCQIGCNTTIYPNAVLYENTRVGDGSIIHSGAVLGAYGFGYRQEEGRHIACAQLGYVLLGNNVEIGANTTIDRGVYGATVVGEGTKIDNLVQIGHNCRLGRHNMICSQVGIAGSTTTGDYVVMAGQVGVRDHVHIGTGAVLGAMAGIANNVPDGAAMIGIPATPEREQKLKQAALAKLVEMRKEFKKLKRTVAELERESVGRRENAA